MNIDFSLDSLTNLHTNLEIVDGMARVSKCEKFEEDDTDSIVFINDFKFHNGVIEVDVCSTLREDAPAHARGFIGIVFRLNDDNNEFETFYIRPANGRDCEDPVRKNRGCQYFSYPGYTFSYFREHGITKYEGAVDTIALGEWVHMKVVVEDDHACLYVNDKLVLSVNDLKHGDSEGKIGLFVDIGTDGLFKNLKVE